jgi:hypothetical protein
VLDEAGDINLQVGDLRTVITVSSAGTEALDTTSNVIGTVVDSMRVRELPLNGRDFLQLALIICSARPLEQRRTSGGKELQPVVPFAFGSELSQHSCAISYPRGQRMRPAAVTEDSPSQKVSPSWGRATPPFPPLVLRCSSGLSPSVGPVDR